MHTRSDPNCLFGLKIHCEIINFNFFIPAMEDDDKEEADLDPEAESHEPDPDQSEAEPLPELSSVELYALRQQKLAERKRSIALLAQDVTENPEQNVRNI